MKKNMIRSLKDYNGKLVWVEFADPNAVGCANDEPCDLSKTETQLYVSGVYRAEGHFLVSLTDVNQRIHEFTPHILAVYEWQE